MEYMGNLQPLRTQDVDQKNRSNIDVSCRRSAAHQKSSPTVALKKTNPSWIFIYSESPSQAELIYGKWWFNSGKMVVEWDLNKKNGDFMVTEPWESDRTMGKWWCFVGLDLE